MEMSNRQCSSGGNITQQLKIKFELFFKSLPQEDPKVNTSWSMFIVVSQQGLMVHRLDSTNGSRKFDNRSKDAVY